MNYLSSDSSQRYLNPPYPSPPLKDGDAEGGKEAAGDAETEALVLQGEPLV